MEENLIFTLMEEVEAQQTYISKMANKIPSLNEFKQKIFYVTETIGHGTNIVTGDYSLGAGGIMIEMVSLHIQ